MECPVFFAIFLFLTKYFHPTTEVEGIQALRSIIFAFLAVFLPQFSLAAINHGVSVLAPVITASSGLPPEAIGLIGGLGGFGAVWFFAANSTILPSLGSLRSLILGCILASLAAVTFALQNGWVGFVAAVLVGFGYAISAPAGSIILAANTPKRIWGTLFSLRMAGVPAGGAFAGLAAAVIVGQYDWRLSLAVLIFPSFLSIIFLKFVSAEINIPERKNPFSFASVFNPKLFLTPFQVLARVPNLATITFVSVGFAAVQGSLFTFFTTYLTDALGFTLSLAGTLYAVVQLSSFLGRIIMGFVADLLGSIKALLAILGICSPFGLLVLTSLNIDEPLWILFFKCSLIGPMIASWNGLFLAEVTRVADTGDVGESTAASTFFTFISYMSAPLIFGFVSFYFSYHLAFAVVGCLAIISFLILIRSMFLTNAKK
jgi:MFS family permease